MLLYNTVCGIILFLLVASLYDIRYGERCPRCKALISFAEGHLMWYCGHCGWQEFEPERVEKENECRH